MKANRLTEEPMIGILPQAESGAQATDVGRQQGRGDATVYQCKANYGGLQVSDAQKLKRLEEDAKRKRRGADLSSAKRKPEHKLRPPLPSTGFCL